jgi:hypothetical protein
MKDSQRILPGDVDNACVAGGEGNWMFHFFCSVENLYQEKL